MTDPVKPQQIVEVIQKIKDIRIPQVKFLISLANNAYKYPKLTEKQEGAFYKCVQELKDKEEI